MSNLQGLVLGGSLKINKINYSLLQLAAKQIEFITPEGAML